MNDAVPSAARLQAASQGALRHGGEPVRRPRRVDQHHAAHPAGVGLRGDPPRPQPLGRGDRQLRAAGRRARHRDLVVPGRARRVLQVHARPAARARRRPHQGVRRRRRRDRAGRDRGAARLRRHAHLLARGRPAARPAGHDQRDRRGVRRRPRDGRCRRRSTRCATAIASRARARWRGSSPGSRTAPSPAKLRDELLAAAAKAKAPALGITGTGGAGKSSLTDELVRRFRLDQQRRAAASRSSRSTRRGASPAARCSATASA